LLGVLGASSDALSALVYYVATYGLTTVGAFGVVTLLEGAKADVTLDDLRGLARRAPVPALALLVFMLSLAGIPPLAGFFGKFYLFVALLKPDPHHLGSLWLVILAIATSAVSLYYYLQVLKRVFVHDPVADTPRIAGAPTAQVGISIAALGVILLGCFPRIVLEPLLTALAAVGLGR
jgi:NADH-quinone oxidoreductase subunit N